MAEIFTLPLPKETQAFEQVTLADQQARRQALDIHQSWIVEAPAGSGKTGLLIQRFLTLLGDESVQQPEQLLAITFTVKATAEMRERILKQLQLAAGPDLSTNEFERETRVLAQAALKRDQALGWKLLKHPRRLNIRTIHSVCGEIARTLPLLAGTGGALSPVDDASAHYREAANRTLMQLGGPDRSLSEDLRTLLLHRDGNLTDCERLLEAMFSMRDQWGDLIPLAGAEQEPDYLDGPIRARLEGALEETIRDVLARLNTAFPRNLLGELVSLAEKMAHSPAYRSTESPIAYCAGRCDLPGNDIQDLQHWQTLIHLLTTKDGWRKTVYKNHLGFEIEKEHATRLKGLHDQLRSDESLLAVLLQAATLPPSKYPEEQWIVIRSLFRVLRRALAELQVVFAERGECDFAELELLARRALRHDSASNGLAEAGMKFQHLLVDEMQDTSSSQYRLLELLTRGWDGRSQTVFLVGDPKQSIYLFRHARVERFTHTMRTGEFGDLTVGRLQLTANFRSQCGLVDAFNEYFSTIFSSDTAATTSEKILYVNAIATRRSTKSVKDIAWHTTTHPPAPVSLQRNSPAHDQALEDAQTICTIIQQWRTRPLPPSRTAAWKIAVLARTKKLLLETAEALKAAGIPYRAVDIEPLGERQEVLDLFSLTRALLHPADRTAWLAILRAPWCGLGLAQIHILAGADDPTCAERSIQDLLEERGDLLSEEGCERLAGFWKVMRAATGKRALLPLSQLVERTWRSLGGDVYLTPEETANAHRYLQLLAELESQPGGIHPSLLHDRLQKLFANSTNTGEAVDLLTIHKAKGLEWDLVFVPGLEKSPRRRNGQLLTWEELDATSNLPSSFVLAPIKGKGEDSQALNAWINRIHTAREKAEQKRLFYVACTRAREELHLFGGVKMNARGEIKPPSGSLLDTTWPIASRYFHAMPAVTSEDNGSSSAPTSDLSHVVSDMAAFAEPRSSQRMQRLPLQFLPQEPRDVVSEPPVAAAQKPKIALQTNTEERFETRAVGIVVHALLELLSKRMSSGKHFDEVRQEVATWGPRIHAMLRAEGVALRKIKDTARQITVALDNSLRDDTGRWILAARPNSSAELEMTAWQDGPMEVRIDRIFKAGPEPMIEGDRHLWIVDYKTAICHSADIEEFLAVERARYEPQLIRYARLFEGSHPKAEMRIGLYFPLLPKFIWWKPDL